jgi:hypothetical protein
MNARTFSITILAALLAVLAFASSAGAECAWALWVRHTFVNVGGKAIDTRAWELESAVPAYATCHEAARQRARRMTEPSPDATNVKERKVSELIGGGFIVSTDFKEPEYSASSVEFQCFPDTIDPRGPKGTPR